MDIFSSQGINAEHPIVALASPRAKSALAIIRICGKGCLSLFEPFVAFPNDPLSVWLPNTIRFCRLIDPVQAVPLEEVMLCVYKAPHSYTGQDAIDINLHGSLISIDNLLRVLYEHGFAEAAPGEFTRRAFINGKLDLTQAEAIHALIEAHSVQGHSLALAQLSGAVTGFIDQIKHSLSELMAICTVSLDYPDDEIQESTAIDFATVESLIDRLNSAISSYDIHRIHREGAIIILAGRTNAGKSAMFNALLREERAIVSNTPGTTRDFLESQMLLRDIPLRIYDTAGLRETDIEIEQEGIQRSYVLLDSADLVLYTVDSSLGLVEEDYQALARIVASSPITASEEVPKQEPEHMLAQSSKVTSTLLVLWNKTDLPNSHPAPSYIDIPHSEHTVHIESDSIISLSATGYSNIIELQDAMYQILHNNVKALTDDLSVISSLRQKQLLEVCRDSLVHVAYGLAENQPLDMISLDIESALSSLGQITGEVTNEELLDLVFGNFCVGK